MKEAIAIHKIVDKKYGVTKEELLSKKKTRDLVDIRRVITMVLLDNTKLSYKKIAEIIGRGHCVICHYQKTSPTIFRTNQYLMDCYDYITFRYKFELDDGKSLSEEKQNLLNNISEIEEEIERINQTIEFNKTEELCV